MNVDAKTIVPAESEHKVGLYGNECWAPLVAGKRLLVAKGRQVMVFTEELNR